MPVSLGNGVVNRSGLDKDRRRTHGSWTVSAAFRHVCANDYFSPVVPFSFSF